MTAFNESIVEDAALEWFGELGYARLRVEALTPTQSHGERGSYSEVVLAGRLREAIRRLNPAIPEEAREEALRKVLRVGSPSLTQTNRAFHRMLRDGVPVEYPRPDGSIAGDHVRLVDFGDVRANDWLAVNQFTVIEGQHKRRPDIVIFLNGLPLGLIELKNAADEDATIWSAYAQLQTYKAEIASLLHYNAALVVSDGVQARIGSLTAKQEWFKVWRTIDGEGDAAKTALELEVLVRGVFERQRFLDVPQLARRIADVGEHALVLLLRELEIAERLLVLAVLRQPVAGIEKLLIRHLGARRADTGRPGRGRLVVPVARRARRARILGDQPFGHRRHAREHRRQSRSNEKSCRPGYEGRHQWSPLGRRDAAGIGCDRARG